MRYKYGVVTAASRDANGAQTARYETVRRIAVGGMAEVFLAIQRGDRGFARFVVLKRPLPESDGDQFEARLHREARLLARLHHPGIAAVHDVGRDERGAYVAMEYVEGHDLRSVLRAASDRRDRADPAAAVGLGIQVAAALAYAHAKADENGLPLDIVHRDVSPSNLVVRDDGIVKLLDFGVARDASERSITRSSEIVGKLAYMSPEQLMRWRVDARSDLFSLGLVLWEVLALERPFGNDHVELMRAIPTKDVPSIRQRRPDVPAELDRVLGRLLARDPDQRYSDARAVVKELEAVARALGTSDTTSALARWVGSAFCNETSEGIEPLADCQELEPTRTVGESAVVQPHRTRRKALGIVAVCITTALTAAGAWASQRGEPVGVMRTIGAAPVPFLAVDGSPTESPRVDAAVAVATEPMSPPPERRAAPSSSVRPADSAAASAEPTERPANPSRTQGRRGKPGKKTSRARPPREDSDPMLPRGYRAGVK